MHDLIFLFQKIRKTYEKMRFYNINCRQPWRSTCGQRPLSSLELYYSVLEKQKNSVKTLRFLHYFGLSDKT